jgi:hypothetical protein
MKNDKLREKNEEGRWKKADGRGKKFKSQLLIAKS